MACRYSTGDFVILSPVDFRVRQLPPDAPASLPWTATLYDRIRGDLGKLKPGK